MAFNTRGSWIPLGMSCVSTIRFLWASKFIMESA
jgi:hypothetical protein